MNNHVDYILANMREDIERLKVEEKEIPILEKYTRGKWHILEAYVEWIERDKNNLIDG